MQADLLLDLLKGLLNLPDLVILAVVLICMVLGFRRGFFGSLYGLVGKLIALAAAFFAARAAAPIVAKWVVTPIVGDIFQNQAALGEAAGLSPAVLAPVLKTVGIAILTHISAEVCRDAKESGIAAFVETAGAAVALCVALPLLRAVLDTVTGLL